MRLGISQQQNQKRLLFKLHKCQNSDSELFYSFCLLIIEFRVYFCYFSVMTHFFCAILCPHRECRRMLNAEISALKPRENPFRYLRFPVFSRRFHRFPPIFRRFRRFRRFPPFSANFPPFSAVWLCVNGQHRCHISIGTFAVFYRYVCIS